MTMYAKDDIRSTLAAATPAAAVDPSTPIKPSQWIEFLSLDPTEVGRERQPHLERARRQPVVIATPRRRPATSSRAPASPTSTRCCSTPAARRSGWPPAGSDGEVAEEAFVVVPPGDSAIEVLGRRHRSSGCSRSVADDLREGVAQRRRLRRTRRARGAAGAMARSGRRLPRCASTGWLTPRSPRAGSAASSARRTSWSTSSPRSRGRATAQAVAALPRRLRAGLARGEGQLRAPHPLPVGAGLDAVAPRREPRRSPRPRSASSRRPPIHTTQGVGDAPAAHRHLLPAARGLLGLGLGAQRRRLPRRG